MRDVLVAVSICAAVWGSAAAEPALRCFDRDSEIKPVGLSALGLATVTAKTKVPFSRCAAKTCPGRGYVVAGDVVITAATQGGFVCAVFPNAGGGTRGWLPANALKALPRGGEVPLLAWTGKWRSDQDTTVEIKLSSRGLKVEGSAVWRGQSPENIHDGELDYEGRPVNGILSLKEDDGEYACHVSLRRIGPYLVVEDNLQCGGVNVTFTGVYRRK